jgi:hypothetical protein
MGYSMEGRLGSIGDKKNRGSFRKVCPGTELLGGGLGALNHKFWKDCDGATYGSYLHPTAAIWVQISIAVPIFLI